MMSTNPQPGFVPEGVYDTVRHRLERAKEIIGMLTRENDELKEACARLQTNQGFVKASEVSDQDGEAKITDQKMLTDFVMNSLKLRPREVVIKYRGSVVVEIRPKG